jgi:hypothetical protein
MTTTIDRLRLRDESLLLAHRLLTCLPAATFEMETLCRLAGIKASREIRTAAVECVYRPRLLLNPDFVAEHCKRDEHLFLLVMHELWHVILAHTRLYPRMTAAHNIAFDAIINAGLSRQFPGPEYRGFFEALNPADQFPGLLLRPPEGWPNHPVYPDVGPHGTRRILERLYPQRNAARAHPPFYEEILNLLRKFIEENGGIIIWVEPFLLGDHDDPKTDQRALANPLFSDMLRRMVNSWPPPPFALTGRGPGSEKGDWHSAFGPTTEEARRVFARTLRRCLGPVEGRQRRRTRAAVPGISGLSVLPNPRDRLAPARRLLGAPDTLWNQPGVVKARVPEKPSKAHVYLDVSGSMVELLPHLLGLILPYVASGQADIFQFSTLVEHLSLAQLRQGQLQSTGGTDINCVLEHLLRTTSAVRRALVLTDGYTGAPAADLADGVRERNLRLYAVLPAEAAWQEDLRSIATSITILPPTRTRSPWTIQP